MTQTRSFQDLLKSTDGIVGEVQIGTTQSPQLTLARHRASAHQFQRGSLSDVLIIAQQNISSTSVRFDLGYGWNEHFCASPSAVYVVPAEADAKWVLNGESQCVYMALPQTNVEDIFRQFEVPAPETHLWRLASKGFDEALVHELVLRLWREIVGVGPSPMLESSARIAILHGLARQFQSSASTHAASGRLDRQTLNKVLEAIHELPANGISIETLAQLAGLSPFYFSRLFRNTTGKTPYHYYDSFRFQRACELLTTTHFPISDIARQLGFSGPSPFTRAFQRYAGCSPRTYRFRIKQ
jgi:AraC-like DNA-binding protein